MNTHTRIPTKTSIYEAYKALFLARPELANDVVTGGSYWPHENGAEWLYGEACDLVLDREQDDELRFGKGITTIRTYKSRAARDAIGILADRAEDANRAEQDCIDYGPDRQQEAV